MEQIPSSPPERPPPLVSRPVLLAGKALILTLATMLSGLIGSCVGFIWGLCCGPRDADAALWALGWTAIGSIQGACVAPAWYLGQTRPTTPGPGGELRAWAALVLSSGCGATSLLGLLLFYAMQQDPRLSLALGVGLLFMCLVPLLSFLFARREMEPGLPMVF